MMDKFLLKRVLADNITEVQNYNVMPRNIDLDTFPCYVLVGVRRAGKSYMLFHKIQQMMKSGTPASKILYVNFEDERLADFDTQDFNLLLECHAEVYGEKPTLFLDEIQNVAHWEKFARRLADSGYSVYVTGSNSKMLSGEVATTLGGRYIIREIYPYSFAECLVARGVDYSATSMLATQTRAPIVRNFETYLRNGGLPASILLPVTRDYLSSVYQKIYLGDIIQRNGITNMSGIKIMVRKIAESVCRPLSYNRIANILSGAGGKLSLATVIKYVEYCEDAWLLLRLKNYAAHLSEKESNCKYYFVDNGILSLFLSDKDPMLLENIVALALFRRFGHDRDNETVFFYNTGCEVDFYIPDAEAAIQVCYRLSGDDETFRRETAALQNIARHYPCARRLIVTLDETATLSDSFGKIDVVPAWKFVIEESFEKK